MHSIINELDHKRLEKDVGYFHKKQSTGENIAVFIFNELQNTGELNVTKIRIWENKNSYFEHIKEEDK